MTASLHEIFESRSVAVVGASKDPSKAGHQVVRTLLAVGYLGKVYPVNPKETKILGLLCYTSITEIKEPLDLIVICLPGKAVIAVMEEAEQRGVPTIPVPVRWAVASWTLAIPKSLR
jgi:acyl-CoA synthetase (NDP forming)